METDTLPKPPKAEVVEREHRRSTPDEARLLAGVGSRLTPEGLSFVGSFACHVYRSPLGADFVFLSQSSDLRRIPENVANLAIKQLARYLATAYGHRMPEKRGEKKDIIV